MYWLPYHRFLLQTDLNPGDCQEKLATVVEPYQVIRWIKNEKPYQGSFSAHEFKLCRITHYGMTGYGNNDLPAIHGQLILADATPTQWRVTLQLSKFRLITSALLYFFIFAGCAISIQNGLFLDNAKILIIFLIFPYIIILFGFNLEAHRNKQFLTELLQARAVPF